jgi:hypothetical protein
MYLRRFFRGRLFVLSTEGGLSHVSGTGYICGLFIIQNDFGMQLIAIKCSFQVGWGEGEEEEMGEVEKMRGDSVGVTRPAVMYR